MTLITDLYFLNKQSQATLLDFVYLKNTNLSTNVELSLVF